MAVWGTGRRTGRRGGAKLSLLAVLLLLILVQTAAAQSWYKRSYDRGMSMFRRGQYTRSIEHFRELLDANSTNSLSDNCQFWIGEAYFQLKHYQQAIIEFDRTLTFPNTNKREDALYKIALCHERLGEEERAKELYTRFLAEYPDSRHAGTVITKLEGYGLL